MKKLAKLLLTPFLALSFSLAPAVPVLAALSTTTTNNTTSICEGVGLIDGQSDCNAGNPQQGVSGVVKTAINIISIFVGVLAVIMIIIGGIKYITSSGDSNSINSAKNTILYAIIGLVIVGIAQVIVRFVIDSLP